MANENKSSVNEEQNLGATVEDRETEQSQTLTARERDNLCRVIAESDITDGLLENQDIDALVDLFEAWLERRAYSGPASEHPICAHVDEYVKTLSWSADATEHEKTLVIGNLRGFASHLARLESAKRPISDRGTDGQAS